MIIKLIFPEKNVKYLINKILDFGITVTLSFLVSEIFIN